MRWTGIGLVGSSLKSHGSSDLSTRLADALIETSPLGSRGVHTKIIMLANLDCELDNQVLELDLKTVIETSLSSDLWRII